MSRSPVIRYYDSRLSKGDAQRLHNTNDPALKLLAKHSLVVGEVTVDSGHNLQCISATPLNLTSGSEELGKYCAAFNHDKKAAFVREQKALFKRLLANTTTKELVMPAFGLEDDLAGLNDVKEKERYQEAAINAWLAVWKEHQEGSTNPTSLTFIIEDPVAHVADKARQAELQHLKDKMTSYAGVTGVKVIHHDPVNYCVAKPADRTLLNPGKVLADRSDVTERHFGSDVKVEVFPDTLSSQELLKASYPVQTSGRAAHPAQTDAISVLLTVMGTDGELYVALAGSADDQQLELPLGLCDNASTSPKAAAATALQTKTGIKVEEDSFNFVGDPYVEIPKSQKGALQIRFLHHHSNNVMDPAKMNEALGVTSAATKLEKVSHILSSNKEGYDAPVLQEVYKRHQRSQAYLKEGWQKAKEAEKDFEIMQTSGSGNNDCFGAAFGDAMLLQAVSGEAVVQEWFKDKADRFFELFDALKVQNKDFKKLYGSGSRVDGVVDENRVKDFAALSQLPTEERQARLGAAIRVVLVKVLGNDLSKNKENRHYGNQLFQILKSDFEKYLEDSKFKSKDTFEGMQFVAGKFKELKEQKPQPTKEDLIAALEKWWHEEGGYANYIQEVGKKGVYLGDIAGGAVADYFGLKLRYKNQSESNIRSANDLADNDAVNNPTLYLHYSPGHWSSYQPKALKERFNGDIASPERQFVPNVELIQQEKAAEKDRRAKEIVAMPVGLGDFNTFTQNLAAFYSNSTHKDEEFSYKESGYFTGFDAGAITLQSSDGISLELSTSQETVGGKTQQLLKIRAKDPDNKDKLNAEELKAKKLKAIARGYATAFADGGHMPKDNLQINVEDMDPLYTEGEVVDALKAAGFKRILIKGVEKYNAVRDESEGSETASEESSSKFSASEVTSNSLVPSSKSMKEAAQKYPVETGILAAAVAGAVVSALTSDNPFKAAGNALVLGVMGLTGYEVYKHGPNFVSKSQQQIRQLSTYLRDNSKQATTYAIQAFGCLALAYYSGLDPQTWSGFFAIQFLQAGASAITEKALTRTSFSDTKKWIITMVVSRSYIAYRTLLRGDLQTFLIQAVGIDNLMKLPDFAKSKAMLVASKMPKIPGSDLVKALVFYGAGFAENKWNKVEKPARYLMSGSALALTLYLTGGTGFAAALPYLMYQYNQTKELAPEILLQSAGFAGGLSLVSSAVGYFAPMIAAPFSYFNSNNTIIGAGQQSLGDAPREEFDNFDSTDSMDSLKGEDSLPGVEEVVDSSPTQTGLSLFGSRHNDTPSFDGPQCTIAEQGGGLWTMCCAAAEGATQVCYEQISTALRNPAFISTMGFFLINSAMGAMSGDTSMLDPAVISNSNSTLLLPGS